MVLRTEEIGERFDAAQRKYNLNLKALAVKTQLSYGTVSQYVRFYKWRMSIGNVWAPAQLPDSVDSQMRLTRLEPDQFKDAINNGRITRNMGRKEVLLLVRQYRRITASKSTGTTNHKPGGEPPTEVAGQTAPPGKPEQPTLEMPFDLEVRRQALKTAIMTEAALWPPERADQLLAALKNITEGLCLKRLPT
jgi:hypothetical protein